MAFTNPIFLEIEKIFGFGQPTEVQERITEDLLKIEIDGLNDDQRDAIYDLMILAFQMGKEENSQ